MTGSILCRPLLALVLWVLAAAPSLADIKIVERTTLDFSQMTLMGVPVAPDQIEMIKQSPVLAGANAQDVVIQASGDCLRCDAPVGTSIVDFKAKSKTLLMPKTSQYAQTSIPDNRIAPLTAGCRATVTDGNQTKTILGHVTHLYTFAITNGSMSFDGTAWIATDLPDVPSIALDSSNPALGFIKSKLSGTPLAMNARIDLQGMVGGLIANYAVTSLSTDAIPAGVFAVPDGYQKTDAPAVTPDLDLQGLMSQQAPSKP